MGWVSSFERLQSGRRRYRQSGRRREQGRKRKSLVGPA
jgi:hypothetical protein